MRSDQPTILHRSEWDRALFWMVFLSAMVHVIAIVLLMLLPDRFQLRPTRLTAYTVELVSSEQIAGTNLIPGNKGEQARARVLPPKVEPKPPPPPPKAEPAPPPPPKAEAPKPEPPPPPKPEPKKEEPKVVEEKAVALAAASAPKPSPATPTPVVQARAAPAAKQQATASAEAKPPREQLAPPSKTPPATEAELAARERDERIAAAIKRVQQRGAGSTESSGDRPGGVVSVGPGEGPGAGVVKGVEYLLYYNLMKSRLKEAWAWADRSRQIEADVQFGVDDDGTVSDVRISRSSGDQAFDASVVRAVRAVSPLPPPPEAHRKEFKDVEFTFNLNEME